MRARSLTAVMLAAILMLTAVPATAFGWPMDFRFNESWGVYGQSPGQMYFATHIEVTKDSQFVWVNDATLAKVTRFYNDGSGPSVFGTSAPGPNHIGRAEGIGSDRFGNIYVADMNDARVRVLSPAGEFLRSFPTSMGSPWAVAVSPNNDVFVADSRRIERYDNDGHKLGSFDTTMTRMGEISCDLDGNVYAVADGQMGVQAGYLGDRAVEWGPAGQVLRSWGASGHAEGKLFRPMGVKVDPVGRVYIADTSNQRVQVFGQDGALLSILPGSFWYPYDVSLGGHRDIYVLDMTPHVVSYATTSATVYQDIKGNDRIETAIEISKRTYPSSTGTVILTTGWNWPDALASAALAGRKRAPILLINPARGVDARVLAEVERLGATEAIVLGDRNTIPDDILGSLLGAGVTGITRIGGSNRYATASMIASAAVAGTDPAKHMRWAFLATGGNYPDALAASPISAADGIPLYLASKGATLPAGTIDAIRRAGTANVTVLGDSNAVPETVVDQLELEGFTVDRKSGDDRYATAAAVAEDAVERFGMGMGDVAISRGDSYPDALVAGPMQGKRGQLMLLTNSKSLPAGLSTYLPWAKGRIYGVRFLGGDTSILPAVRNAIKSKLY